MPATCLFRHGNPVLQRERENAMDIKLDDACLSDKSSAFIGASKFARYTVTQHKSRASWQAMSRDSFAQIPLNPVFSH